MGKDKLNMRTCPDCNELHYTNVKSHKAKCDRCKARNKYLRVNK